MKIRLWGVRGSIPSPGPETVKYGGNTACIEVRHQNQLLIIDAGSGIRALGDTLMAHDLPKGPLKIHLFLSHTHWDHILGFPFFTPIFIPGTEIHIYGPVTYEQESLEKALSGQMKYRYFPVRQKELAADIQYHPLTETSLTFPGGLRISTRYMNHPLLCLGYRFETDSGTFCTIYDTEPYYNYFAYDKPEKTTRESIEEAEKVIIEETKKTIRFMKGADLIIHDAQYTQEEYESSRRGFGHSYPQYALQNSLKAGAKEVVMFHHDIRRTDQELDAWQEIYKEQSNPRVTFAQEGMEWDL